LVAAALSGASALGVDISPFSALLSRARVATYANPKQVLAYLNRPPRVEIEASDVDFILQRRDETYAASVIARIYENVGVSPHDFWHQLLEDDSAHYDSEAVAILSLALGARDSARLIRGSNPIWYKRIQEQENAGLSDLQSAAKRWARIIATDLSSSPPIVRGSTRVIHADFTRLSLKASFEFCLTSPPSLNRLDYVIAHLAELAVLKHVTRVDMDQLRASMIGTTKIVSKDETTTPDIWGSTCRMVLEKIWTHKGYASRRYYYHTYRQYFSRL